MKNNLIAYLAAPYSHENPAIREQRVRAVNQKAAALMLKGFIVFSPLSHSHPISQYCPDPCDQEFWLKQDLPFLKVCHWLFVYRLPGWEQSKGIKREIEEAERLQIPVMYI